MQLATFTYASAFIVEFTLHRSLAGELISRPPRAWMQRGEKMWGRTFLSGYEERLRNAPGLAEVLVILKEASAKKSWVLTASRQYALLRQLIEELPMPSDPPLIEEISRVFGVEGITALRARDPPKAPGREEDGGCSWAEWWVYEWPGVLRDMEQFYVS
eukprot:Skav219818  [mRNA]  locus=scaffold147:412250:415612:+ [translate_table: standard]